MDVQLVINKLDDLLISMIEIIESDVLYEDLPNGSIIDKIKLYATIAKNVSHKHQTLVNLLRLLELSRDELLFVIEGLMHENDIKEIETDDIKVKFRKCPSRVLIHDESKIDSDYFYDKRTLDRKLIVDHLKNGMPVAGAELIQDEHIDIKYKTIKSKEHV